MKKVNLTIRTERTFSIEFDETKINKKFIEAWSKGISDIREEPAEISCYCIDLDISEDDYPYLNLAKSIAYAIHVNESDNLEGLGFQDITKNELFSTEVDNDIPVHYERIGYLEDDYEFDLDNTEL
ncbi:MAG: hypothetical protein LBV74_01240 [Tannerella sp.]|jgi:hypothetical protein|nr:hypothetical protein [Tannerella sp.]